MLVLEAGLVWRQFGCAAIDALAHRIVEMVAHDDDLLSEAETVRRREAALKRMLNTPHKPLAKFKGKSAATGKRKRVTRSKAR